MNVSGKNPTPKTILSGESAEVEALRGEMLGKMIATVGLIFHIYYSYIVAHRKHWIFLINKRRRI